MASLRRLSFTATTGQAARAFAQKPSATRVANYSYWSSRSGATYGRSQIYTKDTYYARRIEQRNASNTRTCGSWARHPRSDEEKRDSKQTTRDGKSSAQSSVSSNQSTSSKAPRDEDGLFDVLWTDADAAWQYLQKELDKHQYQWSHDPKRFSGSWGSPEWWEKQTNELFTPKAHAGQTFPAQAPSATNQKTPSSANYDIPPEDFIIDPITLRKVPRPTPSPDAKATAKQAVQTESVYDIPVRTFKDNATPFLDNRLESSRNDTSAASKLTGFANQPWLVKEGFSEAKDVQTPRPITQNADSASTPRIEPSLNRVKRDRPSAIKVSTPTRIESSLDRAKKGSTTVRPDLQYPPAENQTDDVDLLRASDIRAASGHIKSKPVVSNIEKKAMSEVLNKDWNESGKKYSETLLGAYDEILDKKRKRLARSTPTESEQSTETLSAADFKKVKKHYDELRSEINQTAKILGQARKQVLHDRLNLEVTAVKKVFDGFDDRSRKQMIALNDIKETSKALRDSTANVENTHKLEAKLEQLKRDAHLVGTIRNIYEEKYGKITVEHRQPLFSEQDESESVADKAVFYTPASTPEISTKAVPGNPVRDLLYHHIEQMAVPETTQRRLKFALRGVPELDTIIEQALPAATSSVPASADLASTTTPASVLPASPAMPAEIPPVSQSDLSTEKHHGSDSAYTKKHEEYTYVYKILALDHASNEVAVATTTSSIKHKSSVPRSAAGVLVHLDQPAKYFTYMEKLDAEGFQLVSGSRTMLVYRRRVSADGSPVPEETTVKTTSTSSELKPLREEPVFSGHLQPRERLLRSYQLAHRRARHSTETKRPAAQSAEVEEEQEEAPKRRKYWRSFANKTGTIFLAVLVCYAVGVVHNAKTRRQLEESARLRREEAAQRRAEAEKKDWRWL